MAFMNDITNRPSILVVDDEPVILRIVSVNLTLSGYDVLTTTSGEEALRLVESEKPDIMLLDVLLKNMSGLNVLSRLRTFSSIPVIVFTGLDDAIDTALQKGANDYITKPFKSEDLIAKINSLLENNRAAQEQSTPTIPDESKI